MVEDPMTMVDERADRMRELAGRYVKLVLAVGRHDPVFVDAYYGDPAWRDTAAQPIDALVAEARSLIEALRLTPPAPEELDRLRARFLEAQLVAVETRLEMLAGQSFSFDEESRRLFDAVAPHHTEADFAEVIAALDARLPGPGRLIERYDRFRQAFLVPGDRLASTFTAALAECQRRTRRHLALPAGERFRVELVNGQPWSAYNWYEGGLSSLIQINTDLPVAIDRVLDLACHEGYPGHHVYNALLESHLVRERGWIEFSVYPLLSPQSLIAEGTANFGIEIAFPAEDRLAFERDTLYRLAGLDPDRAAEFAAVQQLVNRLHYAGNEAARGYLEGRLSPAETIEWLENWAMMPADRATQRLRFFDRYRSYVITYNVGLDIVRAWVERRAGTAAACDLRWREFGWLLRSPQTPGGLLQDNDQHDRVAPVGGDDGPSVDGKQAAR